MALLMRTYNVYMCVCVCVCVCVLYIQLFIIDILIYNRCIIAKLLGIQIHISRCLSSESLLYEFILLSEFIQNQNMSDSN